MKQEVTIRKIEDGHITAGCDKRACEGCKGSFFCKSTDSIFEILNKTEEELNVGDKVKVNLDSKKTVFATLISLALPLSLLIGGMVLGYVLKLSEPLQFLLGAIGLAIGFLFGYFYFRYTKKSYLPEVEEKL
ncbi:MAG: SoxR reducing system RseC family protein [Sphaerochaetaceae bacterium]|nr:SoxR reducing system RseC family protein [Sphaerochaetaceae bacterium]